MKKKTYFASFNRFEFRMPYDAVKDCHHQGACDEDVKYWTKQLNLQLDADKLRAELKEYGAWNDDDLSKHYDNLERIIWIAAGNIQEEYPDDFE